MCGVELDRTTGFPEGRDLVAYANADSCGQALQYLPKKSDIGA